MTSDELVDIIYEMLIVDLPENFISNSFKLHNSIHFTIYGSGDFVLTVNNKTRRADIIICEKNN